MIVSNLKFKQVLLTQKDNNMYNLNAMLINSL